MEKGKRDFGEMRNAAKLIFLYLANALSALYPVGHEEKRLPDVMLLAVPR